MITPCYIKHNNHDKLGHNNLYSYFVYNEAPDDNSLLYKAQCIYKKKLIIIKKKCRNLYI
jgi:hypothetical protein